MSDLTSIESKLDELLELQKMNARNIYTLYRRTTALAHMVEALSDGQEPRLPKTLRAEIDASLSPEYFSDLAERDKDEFTRRYGEQVFEILKKKGIDSITKIGEFAPTKHEQSTH
ncbi:MAG: hypothetical protein MRY32_05440 [Rickettsiales bacterium]|nr:hypothetical protein [Rickettsiales bacterium]